MNSRTIVANKQRNANYHPSGAIASHVLKETQEIDSTEKVLEINGSYWVLSEKFAAYRRYYRVVIEDGVWYCSASNEKVAKLCKASVQAYIATLVPENGTVSVPSKSKPGTVHTMTIRNGKAVGCDCDERKAVGIEKYGFKACHHMNAFNHKEQAA